MKARQFIKKFLYNSSSIKHIYLCSPGGHKVEIPLLIIVDPMNKEYSDNLVCDYLDSTFLSFQIQGDEMRIYCK